MQKVNIIHASKREIKGEKFTLNYKFPSDEGFLIYVIDGKGKIILNDKPVQFSKNTFLLCKGGDTLSYRFIKNGEGSFYFVRFTTDDGKPFTHTCGLENILYHCYTPNDVISCIKKFIREFIIRSPQYEENISCLFHELIYTLSISKEKNNDVTAAIYKLAEDIQENFMQGEIDVNEYAKSVGLSKDRFSVLFKQHFSYPPYKYQLMLKMDEAAALLQHTDLPVNKISDMLGFSNQLYFSSAFKKQTGIPPTDVRKKKLQIRQGLNYKH